MEALQTKSLEDKGDGDSEGIRDKVESNEEMPLIQYQKEAKAESMARRGATKDASWTKKRAE